MSAEREMRVSDRERQAAVDRLKAAHDEGRLDFAEYDDRLAAAYGARTYGEIQDLFDDLPTALVAPSPPPSPRPVPPTPAEVTAAAGGLPLALKILWTLWAGAMAINLTVWLLVSLGNGEPDYFWPMWLLVPGSVLFVASIAVVAARNDRRPPGNG